MELAAKLRPEMREHVANMKPLSKDPGDAEVSGSGGIDDDGLGLDAWVSDDGPAGVDGRCGDGASPSPRSCPFPCSSSCPSSSKIQNASRMISGSPPTF